MKNLYLLLIVSFLVSCVPKQYGRYFSYRPNETRTESRIKTDSTSQIELIASTTHLTTLELTNETEVESQSIEPSSLKVEKEEMAQEKILLDSIDGTSETVLPIANQPIGQRKIEPLGILGFSLFVLGLLGIILLWWTAAIYMMIPIVIFGVFFSGKSLRAIKKEPMKYKGSAFGKFVIFVFTVLAISGLLILNYLLNEPN